MRTTRRTNFVAMGDPVGKGRPRFTRSGHIYTPKRTKDYEKRIKAAAPKHMFKGPVRMRVNACFKIPKSWTKKKKAAMDGQPHTQKPDGSNVLKAVEDALNGVVYADDSQVWLATVKKTWQTEGYTEVTVVEDESDRAN